MECTTKNDDAAAPAETAIMSNTRRSRTDDMAGEDGPEGPAVKARRLERHHDEATTLRTAVDTLRRGVRESVARGDLDELEYMENSAKELSDTARRARLRAVVQKLPAEAVTNISAFCMTRKCQNNLALLCKTFYRDIRQAKSLLLWPTRFPTAVALETLFETQNQSAPETDRSIREKQDVCVLLQMSKDGSTACFAFKEFEGGRLQGGRFEFWDRVDGRKENETFHYHGILDFLKISPNLSVATFYNQDIRIFVDFQAGTVIGRTAMGVFRREHDALCLEFLDDDTFFFGGDFSKVFRCSFIRDDVGKVFDCTPPQLVYERPGHRRVEPFLDSKKLLISPWNTLICIIRSHELDNVIIRDVHRETEISYPLQEMSNANHKCFSYSGDKLFMIFTDTYSSELYECDIVGGNFSPARTVTVPNWGWCHSDKLVWSPYDADVVLVYRHLLEGPSRIINIRTGEVLAEQTLSQILLEETPNFPRDHSQKPDEIMWRLFTDRYLGRRN